MRLLQIWCRPAFRFHFPWMGPCLFPLDMSLSNGCFGLNYLLLQRMLIGADMFSIVWIQSAHHVVVTDLVPTSFLFSVPMDGPMSFSTRHVSVQWVLRFELFTTPKNVDWTRLKLQIRRPKSETYLFVSKVVYGGMLPADVQKAVEKSLKWHYRTESWKKPRTNRMMWNP